MLTSSVVPGSDLIEAVLDGEPEADAVAVLREQVTETAEQQGGVRVLVEVRGYEDPRSTAVQRDLRDLGRSPVLRRWAIVSPSAPFRAAATAMLAFLPAEGRVFEHRDDAAEWLRS